MAKLKLLLPCRKGLYKKPKEGKAENTALFFLRVRQKRFLKDYAARDGQQNRKNGSNLEVRTAKAAGGWRTGGASWKAACPHCFSQQIIFHEYNHCKWLNCKIRDGRERHSFSFRPVSDRVAFSSIVIIGGRGDALSNELYDGRTAFPCILSI